MAEVLKIKGDNIMHSEETKQKMREKATGRKLTDETKQKLREYRLGKKHSEETKIKISLNHFDNSGEKNPMFGKHHSEETKKKISLNSPHLSGKDHPQWGKSPSLETREKIGLANSGENSPWWRGGIKTDKEGYKLIKNTKHPYCDSDGYIRLHRLIMEKIIGRYILPAEVVHHKNGNCSDNSEENLELLPSQSEHAKLHKTKEVSNV